MDRLKAKTAVARATKFVSITDFLPIMLCVMQYRTAGHLIAMRLVDMTYPLAEAINGLYKAELIH